MADAAAAAGAGESLYAAAVLIDELRHDDASLRLNAMRKLGVIAQALGEARTRDELVPFVSESVDDDDEVLLALAEQLGKSMVPLVGGGDFGACLLDPLERLASNEESAVRDRAVASMVEVAENLSSEALSSSLLPRVQRLAEREWFTARVAAAALIPPTMSLMSKESGGASASAASPASSSLVRLFLGLVGDDTPMVRRSVAKHLADVGQLLGSEACGVLADPARRLASDDQDSVRLLAVEAWAGLMGVFSRSDAASVALPVVQGLARDSSWRVRWAVASQMVTLADALGPESTQSHLLEPFLSLVNDAEAEVRTAAAARTTDMARRVSEAAALSQIMPAVQALSQDPSEPVRCELAGCVMGLAPVLGSEATIEHLLPIFLRLLKDEASQVRLNVISKLDEVNAVVGVRLLSESLLPSVMELARDPQWRVRAAVLDLMPSLASQLGKSVFEAKGAAGSAAEGAGEGEGGEGNLALLTIECLRDDVAMIRSQAAATLAQLAAVFGQEWAAQVAADAVKNLAQEPVYLLRTTALRAAVALSQALSPEAMAADILPTLARLAADKVPNIRFNAAKALGAVHERLDAAGKDDAKATLQQLHRDADADVRFFAEQALLRFE